MFRFPGIEDIFRDLSVGFRLFGEISSSPWWRAKEEPETAMDMSEFLKDKQAIFGPGFRCRPADANYQQAFDEMIKEETLHKVRGNCRIRRNGAPKRRRTH